MIPDDDKPAGELQECYTTRWGLLKKECYCSIAYTGRNNDTKTYPDFPKGMKNCFQNDSGGSSACKVDDKCHF